MSESFGSSVPTRRAASSRAQASAARTSSTVSCSPEGTSCARKDVGDRGHDPRERQPAGPERLHARPRWPRCRPPARCRPPPRPARASEHRRERLVVEREELPGLRPGPVDGRRGVGHPVRPGQPERDRDEHRRRAGLHAASSRRRTRPSSARREVGCTTTSIRSKGMPKSRCASITSSPLLTRVAELIVTTGPMSQVGWASASSTVTSASCSRGPAAERAAARGQHQPAYLVGRAAAQALGERRVLGVDRHDLARPRALR